jgi:hypothetical protein
MVGSNSWQTPVGETRESECYFLLGTKRAQATSHTLPFPVTHLLLIESTRGKLSF